MTVIQAVHDRLREIALKHRGDLAVTADEPGGVTIEVPGLEGKPWGCVAGTRLGKTYVSYYLMPVYAAPGLMESMSPELRKRMQGKACFNFTKVDEPLLNELDALTARAIPGFRAVAAEVDATAARADLGRHPDPRASRQRPRGRSPRFPPDTTPGSRSQRSPRSRTRHCPDSARIAAGLDRTPVRYFGGQ